MGPKTGQFQVCWALHDSVITPESGHDKLSSKHTNLDHPKAKQPLLFKKIAICNNIIYNRK